MAFQPTIPSNYGGFISEPLANLSGSKGPRPDIAKEELNVLAKLVGCNEKDEDDLEESGKKFKISLFDMAGLEIGSGLEL